MRKRQLYVNRERSGPRIKIKLTGLKWSGGCRTQLECSRQTEERSNEFIQKEKKAGGVPGGCEAGGDHRGCEAGGEDY